MLRYAEVNYPGASRPRREPLISNGVFGMIVFVAVEIMFFGGLISAYLITVADAPQWPPVGQPRLPVVSTAVNTLALLASGAVLFVAQRKFEARSFSRESQSWLLAGLGLGVFFVAFQGLEWVRLVSYGVTMRSSSYGSFFYLLIGTHALHAIAAIATWVRVFLRMRSRKLSLETFRAAQVFWCFVVGMWPILYVLVYLR